MDQFLIAKLKFLLSHLVYFRVTNQPIEFWNYLKMSNDLIIKLKQRQNLNVSILLNKLKFMIAVNEIECNNLDMAL